MGISEIVERILTNQNQNISELDTRSILIEPFLKVAGWNTLNTNEVKRHQQDTSGKFPDYELVIDGKCKIVIEAKKLDSDVDKIDTKSTLQDFEQALDYAYHKGIEIAVLTNGSKYLVAHAMLKASTKKRVIDTFNLVEDYKNSERVERLLSFISKKSIEQENVPKILEKIFLYNQVKYHIEFLLENPSTNFAHYLQNISKNTEDDPLSNHSVNDIKNCIKDLYNSEIRVQTITSDQLTEIKKTEEILEEKNTDNIERGFIPFDKYKSVSSNKVITAVAKLVDTVYSGYKIDCKQKYFNIYDDNNNIVCSICLQRKKYKIYLSGGHVDETEINNIHIRDVSGKGHWGNGNIEFDIDPSIDVSLVKETIVRVKNSTKSTE